MPAPVPALNRTAAASLPASPATCLPTMAPFIRQRRPRQGTGAALSTRGNPSEGPNPSPRIPLPPGALRFPTSAPRLSALRAADSPPFYVGVELRRRRVAADAHRRQGFTVRQSLVGSERVRVGASTAIRSDWTVIGSDQSVAGK